MAPRLINSWLMSKNNSRTGRHNFMYEHLKRRDQVREITRDLIQTFGALQPKLEHFATTPLPDKASVIKILDDLLEVMYPGYFGRTYVESSNIEYYVGDLLDSIYARMTEEIYRSIRPECKNLTDACDHCLEIAETKALLFLRKLTDLRGRPSDDVRAA